MDYPLEQRYNDYKTLIAKLDSIEQAQVRSLHHLYCFPNMSPFTLASIEKDRNKACHSRSHRCMETASLLLTNPRQAVVLTFDYAATYSSSFIIYNT